MHGGDDGPNLVPLLDLVLQLIMFLMITANFVAADAFNKEVQLPVVQQATLLERKADYFVFLNMDKDGHLLLPAASEDGMEGTKEQKMDKFDAKAEARLKQHLQKRKQELEQVAAEKGAYGINVTVVLRADGEATYADVYRILDACTRAGYFSSQLRVKTKT